MSLIESKANETATEGREGPLPQGSGSQETYLQSADSREAGRANLLYKVCKRTIERGGCPEDMALRVSVFYGAGLISTEEYDGLTALLNRENG